MDRMETGTRCRGVVRGDHAVNLLSVAVEREVQAVVSDIEWCTARPACAERKGCEYHGTGKDLHEQRATVKSTKLALAVVGSIRLRPPDAGT